MQKIGQYGRQGLLYSGYLIMMVIVYSIVTPYLPNLFYVLTVFTFVYLCKHYWANEQDKLRKHQKMFNSTYFFEKQDSKFDKNSVLQTSKYQPQKSQLFHKNTVSQQSVLNAAQVKAIFNHVLALICSLFVLKCVETSTVQLFPQLKYYYWKISIVLVLVLDLTCFYFLNLKKATQMLFTASLTNFFIIFSIIFLRYPLYGLAINSGISIGFGHMRKWLRQFTLGRKKDKKLNTIWGKLKLCLVAIIGVGLIVFVWIYAIKRSQVIFCIVAMVALIIIVTVIVRMKMERLEDYINARSQLVTLLFTLFLFVLHWNYQTFSINYWFSAPIALASLSYEINWKEISWPCDWQLFKKLFEGDSPVKFIARALLACTFLLTVQIIKYIFNLH